MAKIILKNASACTNPVLTKVQRTYNGENALITFYLQNGTLNPPDPNTGGNIGFERFNGSTWQTLQSFPYLSYQYVWTIGSDGIGANLNLGTLFRVKLTTNQCGDAFTNSSPLVL